MGSWSYGGNETIELHDAMEIRLHHRRTGKEFGYWDVIDRNSVGRIWIGSLYKHSAASVIRRHIEDTNASTVSRFI